jgi:diphthine-ammonia ligase
MLWWNSPTRDSQALITGVKLEVIGEEFRGTLSTRTRRGFSVKDRKLDPLGENGEFHTLVLVCPLYPNSFELKSMRKTRERGVAYLVVSIA